jgi:hypothetical protein
MASEPPRKPVNFAAAASRGAAAPAPAAAPKAGEHRAPPAPRQAEPPRVAPEDERAEQQEEDYSEVRTATHRTALVCARRRPGGTAPLASECLCGRRVAVCPLGRECVWQSTPTTRGARRTPSWRCSARCSTGRHTRAPPSRTVCGTDSTCGTCFRCPSSITGPDRCPAPGPLRAAPPRQSSRSCAGWRGPP